MGTLSDEVAKFRDWATIRLSARYKGDQYSHGAEWECDYPNWPALYLATSTFLDAAADRILSTDDIELLIYVLGRDNEDEHVLEMLAAYPNVATQVAGAAVKAPDADARWQAAVLAGRVGSEGTVRLYLDDTTEYVRRRAKLALNDLKER